MNPLRLLFPLLACALALPVAAAPVYEIKDYGFSGFWGYGLNNAGDVIGGRYDKDGWHAYVASGDSLTRLYGPGDLTAIGYAINDAGGFVVQHSEPQRIAPVVVSGGTFTDLGVLGNTQFTEARAINNSGQVAGGNGHAYLYDAGTGLLDLGTLGGPGSWGRDVNNIGTVVGGSQFNTGGAVRAFIYRDGTMQSLGSLDGRDSEAEAVNDSDVAVGWANRPGDLTYRAVLFAGGTVTELGSLNGTGPSIAHDINNLGDIVGGATVASGGYHAFLYRDGTMVDLNDLVDPAAGLLLTGAVAVNDSHEILAIAKDAAGFNHSVLLTLSGRSVSPVPEPGVYTMLLVGLGLGGVLRLRQRRLTRQSRAA